MKTTTIYVNGHGYVVDQATGRCVDDFDLVRKREARPIDEVLGDDVTEEDVDR